MAYTTDLTTALRTANRHLQRYSQLQGDSIARLSSGRRAYMASDDPVGLSTGSVIKAERIGLRAVRDNLQISSLAIQAASSGVSSIEYNLTEARSLASRAASDVLTDDERAIASEQFDQLMKNIDSLAGSTRIGDQSLLATSGVIASVGNGGIGADNDVDLVASQTRGFAWHDFTEKAKVTVSTKDSRYEAKVSFGDYEFTGLAPTDAGDNFILTEDDGVTTLAIDLDVPASAGAFRTALEGAFAKNKKLRIGTDSVDARLSNAGTGATFSAQASAGFFSGRATRLSVNTTATGYSARLELNTGQSFVAQKATADTSFEFVDTADLANKIVITDVEGGANKAAALHKELAGFLNLDGGGAVFSSASAATAQRTNAKANDISVNGFDARTSVKAGVGSVSGSYGFSYDSASRLFRVSNGTQSVRVAASTDEQQTLSFGNGIVVQIGSQSDPFDSNKDIAQRTFTVNSDGVSSLDVGLSTDGTVRRQLNFARLTSHSLGLDDLNLASRKSAQTALEKLDFAVAFTGASLAALGGQERSLGVLVANTSSLMNGHQAAENALLGVNIGQELALQTEYQLKAQTAAFSFTTVRDAPQRLIDLLVR